MFIVDPNIVYLALIFGLWIGVTAVYMPGTGLLEFFSAASVIGVVLALGSMPTNWGAVVLVIVGALSFIVIPFIRQQLLVLALGGLIMQALGGLFMFHGTVVSPVIIALIVVISLIYHRYILIPMLEKARMLPVNDESDGLIGARGRVVKALNPLGTVNVHGELWTASSEQPLDAGDEVIVVERDGLNILVEGIKHKRAPVNGHEE